MRILALETSTRRATIVLADGERTVASRHHDDPLTHDEHLIPLIDEVVAEAGITKSSLDVIACGIGPGSFTGVRVALATTKGIALALDRPIVGIGSLRAMAAGIDEPRPELVVPVLDARKQELFVAVYDAAGAERLAPIHVPRASFAELVAPYLAQGAVVIGEVASELDLDPAVVRRGDRSDLPDASVIARLAFARARSSDFDSLHALEPIYVRPPDIHPQASQRIARP